MRTWYLVHTKPRQEFLALANLQRQGYQSYLPTYVSEVIRRHTIAEKPAALFPRYLFVQLDDTMSAPSWAPIRSTIGVSRLVRFGLDYARVDDALIAQLQSLESEAAAPRQQLFSPGERVLIRSGPFQGLEAVFQMKDGASRVLVLLQLLSRTVSLGLPPDAIAAAAVG